MTNSRFLPRGCSLSIPIDDGDDNDDVDTASSSSALHRNSSDATIFSRSEAGSFECAEADCFEEHVASGAISQSIRTYPLWRRFQPCLAGVRSLAKSALGALDQLRLKLVRGQKLKRLTKEEAATLFSVIITACAFLWIASLFIFAGKANVSDGHRFDEACDIYKLPGYLHKSLVWKPFIRFSEFNATCAEVSQKDELGALNNEAVPLSASLSKKLILLYGDGNDVAAVETLCRHLPNTTLLQITFSSQIESDPSHFLPGQARACLISRPRPDGKGEKPSPEDQTFLLVVAVPHFGVTVRAASDPPNASLMQKGDPATAQDRLDSVPAMLESLRTHTTGQIPTTPDVVVLHSSAWDLEAWLAKGHNEDGVMRRIGDWPELAETALVDPVRERFPFALCWLRNAPIAAISAVGEGGAGSSDPRYSAGLAEAARVLCSKRGDVACLDWKRAVEGTPISKANSSLY
ncbi:hypothetical protein DFJ73DRAFT_855409 [Zopfochytrium polystomum]|nr:hypothetical protein DFJ73DRAFT_855409 [Zopfochytrium polystomum]